MKQTRPLSIINGTLVTSQGLEKATLRCVEGLIAGGEVQDADEVVDVVIGRL